MSDRPTIAPVNTEDSVRVSADAAPPAEYEPPCLRYVGNLRNLLGKTGPERDFGSVFVTNPRRG